MKNFTVSLCAVFIAACLVPSGFSEDRRQHNEKTVFDKQFKVVSVDGKKELGTYRIKAVTQALGNELKITRSMSMDYRGKKAEMKSAVVYENTSPFSPKKGTAKTKIDGKACMNGTVTFSEKTVDIECQGFLNKRTGTEIIPPMIFAKKDHPVADGVLICASALPVIGPRILPKEGELRDVVSIEFPDDLGAPELITFKTGYRLVRGKANDDGEYDLTFHSPHARTGSAPSRIRFDKNDQVVSISLYGKLKLVEVEKKKKK